MRKSNAVIRTDLASNWEKAKNYIPDPFTIIVYEYDDASPRIKIGDGVHAVGDLPFLNTNQQVKQTEWNEGILSI